MPALIASARDLPPSPLDAASHFHTHVLPGIRADIAGMDEVRLLFDPADHTHYAWRLAAVQSLARELAPARVNAIVGGDREALAEVTGFLARAPGVTGQMFEVAANRGESD